MNPPDEILQRLAEFEAMKSGPGLTPEAASVLSERAAELVIEYHRAGGGCPRQAVSLLCEIATSRDSDIAQAGIKALFPSLIERLNDSFDPAACQLYDRVFAQVIEFCRRLPEAQQLDEGLKRFGLMSEEDLLARKARISNLKSQITHPPSADSVKKVLLLSRVTIGADVAVTSAIIAKLRQAIPQAEFVILGSRKLRELYGGDERIRVREITYERGGSLISRLTSWLDVVGAIGEERRGGDENQVWVIDPDSRLTQLGLLPLVADDSGYFYFESRSYSIPGRSSAIGQLAANWAGYLVGDHSPGFPFIALPAEHQFLGQHVIGRLRQGSLRYGSRPGPREQIFAVSFGVGGNENKRVSAEFEEHLIQHLLADAKLILDKGAGPDESERISQIANCIRAQGRKIVQINEANKNNVADEELLRADVVTWDGSIGAFAGLIAASDKYIGYDSAGQHIAAALGVPTLTVFVNSVNATFAERWQPYGKGKIQVVNVNNTGSIELVTVQ